MAIAAWIQKSSEGRGDVPNWVMVEPIEAELRSKITLAAGIEVVIATHDLSGEEIPGTRIRILGFSDKEGGMINGEKLPLDKMRTEQLGPLSVDFYPEKFDGYGDDIQTLDDYNGDILEEKGESFVDLIRKAKEARRKVLNDGMGQIELYVAERTAGRLLLSGLDEYGLLELRVKRVDKKNI